MSYGRITGATEAEARATLGRALTATGMNRHRMAVIVTSLGWHWRPWGKSVAEFIEAHPTGRYLLAWTGHAGALIDGQAYGLIRPGVFPFLGAWRAPET